jgi:uncharacterized membrane protein
MKTRSALIYTVDDFCTVNGSVCVIRIVVFIGIALTVIGVVELAFRLTRRAGKSSNTRYFRYAVAFFAAVMGFAILDYYLAYKAFGPLEPIKDIAAIVKLSKIGFRTQIVSSICSIVLIVLYIYKSSR